MPTCGGRSSYSFRKAEQAGSFLERPALEDMTVTLTAVGSLLGRQFGPYRKDGLVERLTERALDSLQSQDTEPGSV
jgi:hypothetical protein